MSPIRAHVENGRLILNQPTELPEGLVLDLVIDDEGDDLDAREREALHASLRRSIEQAQAGQLSPGGDILREIRGA